MSLSGLPDELWRRILEIGIRNSNLSFKDLCCISICCRRLHRLSTEDSLWSHLLLSDFPSPSSQQQNPNINACSSTLASVKSTYKTKFERERERKVLVLRKANEIVELRRTMREIETRLRQETQKMRASSIKLSHLRRVRIEGEGESKAAVLRKEREIVEPQRKTREIKTQLCQETEKMRASSTKLSYLCRAR